MPIILHLMLFATLVPSCLSACPSKLCIRLGRGQANQQADILHSCCNGYFNSISTIESSDSSEQYWPGWCHLCGIWMDGAPSSVQWNSGGGPLVAPLLSGRRWCSTTKKQQRSLKTREEWRNGLSLSKLISFKLSLRLSPKHTFYLSLLNDLHAAIIYFQ